MGESAEAPHDNNHPGSLDDTRLENNRVDHDSFQRNVSMKALSINQPWAWAIIKGYKDIENRDWSTKYRGPVIIHASKKWDRGGYNFLRYFKNIEIPSKNCHVFGALIGMVDLISCVNRCDSEWFAGPYGFVLRNAREYKYPIIWKGQLRFFEVDDWFGKFGMLFK